MFTKNTLISIIIPVYNRQELIKEALESCLWQTYQNWECIVVDDGSTDDTWQSLKEYAAKDNRIKIFKRHREPKGANCCRNIGIEKSQGELLIFTDSDDLLAPWCLEERSKCAERKVFDMIVFNVLNLDNCISNVENFVYKIFNVTDAKQRLLNFEILFCTPSVLWKKYFLNKIGAWYEPAMSSQDVILNIIAVINNPKMFVYHQLPDVFIRKQSYFSETSTDGQD